MPRRKRLNKRRAPAHSSRETCCWRWGRLPGGACPQPGSEEWEALRACWEANRDRYGHESWGFLAFELGDIEGVLKANALVPVEANEPAGDGG